MRPQRPSRGIASVSSNMDVYLQRNEAFAATDAKLQIPAIPFVPFKQVYVLTCVDPRVEPAAIIGAQLGDADLRRSYAARGGYDEATAADKAVLDPSATVSADVDLLRTAPALAGSIGRFKVGGYAYDLKTGLLTTVDEPRLGRPPAVASSRLPTTDRR